MSEGGAGFSAPIYNADGNLISVLVITSVTHRARRHLDDLLVQAGQAANEISIGASQQKRPPNQIWRPSIVFRWRRSDRV